MTSERGLVISASRRNAKVLLSGEIVLARVVQQESPTVGDEVQLFFEQEQAYVYGICERRNCLARTYRKRTKELAANLDRLLVVTAVQPLFNAYFVDRILASAAQEGIPASIILNKADLGLAETEPLAAVYEELGYEVVRTSAKTPGGLDGLCELLAASDLRTVVLAGVSGVGKSTILNQLVPEACRATSSVSRKTGQGRQTTSLSVGYLYPRPGPQLLIIDLPGVQSFGVSNLTQREAAAGFSEFERLKSECEFSDCQHTAEPNCAVKRSLEAGQVAESRYESYLRMLEEIEAAREY